LIRLGEKTDYLTSSFSKETLVKQGIKSFIDLKQLGKDFGIEPNSLNSQFFVELLRESFDSDSDIYPSRATK